MQLGALTDADLAFYSTAAQVIPVLLLVLALELSTAKVLREFLSPSPGAWWATALVAAIVFAITLLMFAAELLALGALKNDRVAGGTDEWVMTALLVGVIAVMSGVVDTRSRASQRYGSWCRSVSEPSLVP